MAKDKTSDYWKRWVWRLKEDYTRISSREIAEELLKMRKAGLTPKEEDDPPADRTIRDILKEEPPGGRGEFGSFFWPESMLPPDYPTEASTAFLELLRFHFEASRGAKLAMRPTKRLAKWFWIVTQAMALEAPFNERLSIAGTLAAAEGSSAIDKELMRRGVEGYLAYAAWKSSENEGAWYEAKDAQVVPEMRFNLPYSPQETQDVINLGIDPRAAAIFSRFLNTIRFEPKRN